MGRKKPIGKPIRSQVYWPPLPKTLIGPMVPQRTAAVERWSALARSSGKFQREANFLPVKKVLMPGQVKWLAW